MIKGAIAGTAINDLQEPLINPEGVVNVKQQEGGKLKYLLSLKMMISII